MSTASEKSPALLLIGITTAIGLLGFALPGFLGATGAMGPEALGIWVVVAFGVLVVWAVIASVWAIRWRRRRGRDQA